MKRKKEPMEEHNILNEEKDRNTQRQKTEVVTGREKLDKGAIREVKTQGESATNPKPANEKGTQK